MWSFILCVCVRFIVFSLIVFLCLFVIWLCLFVIWLWLFVIWLSERDIFVYTFTHVFFWSECSWMCCYFLICFCSDQCGSLCLCMVEIACCLLGVRGWKFVSGFGVCEIYVCDMWLWVRNVWLKPYVGVWSVASFVLPVVCQLRLCVSIMLIGVRFTWQKYYCSLNVTYILRYMTLP